jgi:hypothetical protein
MPKRLVEFPLDIPARQAKVAQIALIDLGQRLPVSAPSAPQVPDMHRGLDCCTAAGGQLGLNTLIVSQ